MSEDSGSVVLLDGGMGQELVRRSAGTPTPLWSTQSLIDQPNLVRDLHLDFIRAGARIITVNAYSATPQRLERDGAGTRFIELQSMACQIATQARDQSGVDSVRIAGCLPPLVGSYHAESEPDYQTALGSYRRIIDLQLEHVDVMLCETVASLTHARAVADAACDCGKPVWLALTINDDESASLRSGEPLADAIDLLGELGVDAVLLNCSKPEAIAAAWSTLARSKLPIGAYANAFTSIDSLDPGGTVRDMEARHDLGPDEYAEVALSWVANGASIIGGCCEVGPAHIAKLGQRLAENGLRVVSSFASVGAC